MTAKLEKKHPDRPATGYATFGPAALYRLSEPYTYDVERPPCDYVFVSTARVMGEWETYAFPADASGDCLSWAELPCSMKGPSTHADVLKEMGHELEPVS